MSESKLQAAHGRPVRSTIVLTIVVLAALCALSLLSGIWVAQTRQKLQHPQAPVLAIASVAPLVTRDTAPEFGNGSTSYGQVASVGHIINTFGGGRGIEAGCPDVWVTAQTVGIIAPGYTCGETVLIHNIVTGREAVVTVVGVQAQFSASSRVADMTPAVADLLGAEMAYVVINSRNPNDRAISTYQANVVEPVLSAAQMREVDLLAQNSWGELRLEFRRDPETMTAGLVALNEVVLNRARTNYTADSIAGVVLFRRGNTCAFSWVCSGVKPPTAGQAGHDLWTAMFNIALAHYTDQLVGDAQGIRYAMPGIRHYWNPQVYLKVGRKQPDWTAPCNPEHLVRVVDLGFRFKHEFFRAEPNNPLCQKS